MGGGNSIVESFRQKELIMAYLTKEALLHAYKTLSGIDDNKQQGLTQKVSALRYLFALDRFYKKNGRNCDTKSTDKNEYVEFVGEIVKLSDGYYTSNFYTALYTEQDYKVGSNFFSVNAVKDSLVNTTITVDFPRRSKDGELFKIQNGILLRDASLFQHIDKYLPSVETKIAFALWIVRDLELDEIEYYNLIDVLKSRYSEELVTSLLPKESDFQNYCSTHDCLKLSNIQVMLVKSDIISLFEKDIKKTKIELDKYSLQQIFYGAPGTGKFLPYLTALRTKPFMLLAGISGTGKSRIVRELAKACWKEGDEEYGKNNPRNFCIVQVKPNWHDSSELIGFVSRINGEKYVVGPFLRFMAKAINDPNTPYFLCLDEMNLAPVEQYFAEYLSVIESRKLNADGSITTDPIVPYENTEAYGTLIDQLFYDDADRKEYKSGIGTKRLSIPQNLFVIGTVNMDETTFSFSRKVLDRAMTIEMNEVNLYGGLEEESNEIGYIGNCIIGNAAEGKDIYANNKELCDQVLTYLEKVNTVLEGTPFKIAYRTRNEFLLYAVNRQLLDKDSQLWQTLDEMTSMKILSRIEGDSERTKSVLEGLKVLVEDEINNAIPEPEEGKEKLKSITDTKIEEMLKKLKDSGYTSYWA